jgi:acyl-CoA thioesterase-2
VTEAAGSQAAALLAVLALEERKPDVFVGQTPSTERQRIFGGQVAGQALMAAG